MLSRDVAILGVGMSPWGGRTAHYLELGLRAARAALIDAAVPWPRVQYLAAAGTIRGGYAGHSAAMAYAEGLGFQGADVTTCYGGCTSGAQALATARSRILTGECEVALVIGADVAVDGPLTSGSPAGDNDPELARQSIGISNPVYFALAARRRMFECGTTEEDMSAVRIKNSRHGHSNPNARYRLQLTHQQVSGSPMMFDPLRLLHLASTSSGAAAIVLSSVAFAKNQGASTTFLSAISTATPVFPSSTLQLGRFAMQSAESGSAPDVHSTVRKVYEQAGVGPKDLSLAEVYDLTPVAELESYEHLALCGTGEAEHMLRAGHTRLGGRVPVNPSGGLTAFGESPSAQTLAQVCELTWQLRGAAGPRQVPGATLGIALSSGALGHAAAIVAKI